MRLHIDSTDRVVEIVGDGVSAPARMWEGTTDTGIPVICWVTRIAVKRDQDTSQFQAELAEQRPPSAETWAFPLRMIL